MLVSSVYCLSFMCECEREKHMSCYQSNQYSLPVLFAKHKLRVDASNEIHSTPSGLLPSVSMPEARAHKGDRTLEGNYTNMNIDAVNTVAGKATCASDRSQDSVRSSRAARE